MTVENGNPNTENILGQEYSLEELLDEPVMDKNAAAKGEKKVLKSSLKNKAKTKIRMQQNAVKKGNWPPSSSESTDVEGNTVPVNDPAATVEFEDGSTYDELPETLTATVEKPVSPNTNKKFPSDTNRNGFEGINSQHKVKLVSVNPETKVLMENGIMRPLSKTENGIIFPYTPTIMWGYAANYGSYDMIHGQYQQNYYQNTPSPTVQVTATFTSGTAEEGYYTLAALHFLKWATKGDFGAYDSSGEKRNATAGAPPPILRFSAYGHAGAKNLPVVVRSINYTYPEDIDYITLQPPKGGRVINGIYYSYNEIEEMNYQATEFNEGEYGAVRYPEYKEDATIPSQLLVTLDLAIQIPPQRVRDYFNVKEYALGKTLTDKGFI